MLLCIKSIKPGEGDVMAEGKKFNPTNFTYFFGVSFLALFAIFLSLLQSPSTTKTPQTYLLRLPVFSLIPHPSANVQVAVNSSIEVSVELTEGDHVYRDQSTIHYTWVSSDAQVAKVEDDRPASCLYGISSPCPNLHARITGLKAGNAVITVEAVDNTGASLVSTDFNVTVSGSGGIINYLIKFNGINDTPTNTSVQKVMVESVWIGDPVGGYPQFRNFTFETQATPGKNGVYSGNFTLAAGYLNFPGFKICFKGPKHLRKCFNNVTYATGQTLNYTTSPLDPGDLPLPQNGWADQDDFNYLWNHRGSTSQNDLAIGDLNLDGIINMGDVNLLLVTLSKRSGDPL